MNIRFRFSARKAVEVILWFSNEKPGISLHNLLKLLFYADKHHLNRHGRPIVGDDYIAMQYGPVASTTYEILKGEGLAAELIDETPYPFEIQSGYHVRGTRRPRADVLSETDVEALRWALEKYGRMNFRELTALTHKEPAWANADGRFMRYEDFFEEGDDREERIEDVRDAAPRMVL